MTFNQIQSRIEQAKSLDFGDLFDKSFTLFKKIWLQGAITVFIMVCLVLGLSFAYTFLLEILGLSTGSLDPNQMNGFDVDFFTSYIGEIYGMNLIYNLPITIITSGLTLALLAGFYRICKQKDFEESKSDDYFFFFKEEYFKKIVILALIYAGIATVAQMLCFLPYIYVFVPLSYFAVFLAFNPEKTPEEMMKLSFQLGNKKWLISFGIIFVTFFLAAFGVLLCVIGLLATLSFMYLPVYLIYKEVVGFESDDEIMKIGLE